eukprot:COSAG02_NODE_505_length_20935_cov_38.509119_5_plen_88_part_00
MSKQGDGNGNLQRVASPACGPGCSSLDPSVRGAVQCSVLSQEVCSSHFRLTTAVPTGFPLVLQRLAITHASLSPCPTATVALCLCGT